MHHIELYYYLEDDSIHVSEPRVANSGIPQGLLVKRHRIPHPEPSAVGRVKHNEAAPPGSALALKRTPFAPRYWTFRDLDVGGTVHFYNRRYTLTDADPFTKEFYAETLGSPLSAPLPAPTDPYQEQRKIYVRDADRPPNRRRDAFTRYMEAKMGISGTGAGDNPLKISKYIKHQGRVLRFFGTWDDSSLFGRKHRLVIHYYLCDDTLEVIERLGRNSGCDASASGKEAMLLKRSQLPKDPSKCYLLPGGYAPRPKAHYASGDTRSAGLLNEHASGAQLVVALSEKLGQKTNNIRPIFRSFDEDKSGTVSYTEFRHGLMMLGFEPTDKQFEELLRVLDKDGSGEIDYVEFASTLKPDDENEAKATADMDKMEMGDVAYVHWTDCRPGNSIDVFGKKVVIEDADPFTKRFFILQSGEAVKPHPRRGSTLPPQPTIVLPEHTGREHTVTSLGHPEDSLQNCLSLMPEVTKYPNNDLGRFMAHEGDVLRFEAVLLSRVPEDEGRSFVISYYVRDFTVAVYEPPVRNSGIIGGVFLKRERLLHPDQSDAPDAQCRLPSGSEFRPGSPGLRPRIQATMPKYYQASDLHVGATITVHHAHFRLIKCDLFTLNYMEQRPEIFPEASPDAALASLRAQLAAGGGGGGDGVARLRAALPAGAAAVDVVGLRGAVTGAGCALSDQALIALVRKFDTSSSGAPSPPLPSPSPPDLPFPFLARRYV